MARLPITDRMARYRGHVRAGLNAVRIEADRAEVAAESGELSGRAMDAARWEASGLRRAMEIMRPFIDWDPRSCDHHRGGER